MTDERAAAVVRAGLQKAEASIREQEQELGRLDAAAGDGDHGAGMVRGLSAATASLAALPDGSAGDLLIAAGSAFADASGGASGALYGAWFSTIGQKLGDGPFEPLVVCAALQAGQDIVCRLGKCAPSDKTMIDALAPFIGALGEAATAGQPLAVAWQSALPAAEAGAAATAQMVARRGRSSRLGERSLGHADPGATSLFYIVRAFGAALDEVCGHK
jgi:dihydroxyacetone kinase phosphoprotein-dependent L subunit